MKPAPASEAATPKESGYGPLEVMCSGAGWYVGTVYYDAELDMRMPGDRQSGYFATEQEAAAELAVMQADEAAATAAAKP